MELRLLGGYLLLCAYAIPALSATAPVVRAKKEDGPHVLDHDIWSLELHSLKTHPGREHTTVFTGFQNLRQRSSSHHEGQHVEEEERKEERKEKKEEKKEGRKEERKEERKEGRKEERKEGRKELAKGRSGETKKSTGLAPSSNSRESGPSAGKTVTKSLIYEESNRNRIGWLMPDETIPE